MRIALGIEYDGAGFVGWQSQPNGAGVQDALEAAIARICGHSLRVVCAGRTDAGVHALAQVVHFDTEAVRPLTAWVRGVNAHLPATVAVTWAREVDAEFHARFSARSRSYRYLLLNRPVRPALLSGRVGWHHRPLAVAPMRQAAALLLGEHDFSAFRAAECQAKSPVKTLYRADVSVQGDCIVFDFRASAFLHHMVRNLVGSLVQVGLGKQPPAWMADLLARRDRSLAAPTFDPAGLYFAGVEYDAAWQLPATAPDTVPLRF
ncbi:MAG: tRNA pseudouridine(38-40) synthase TruA [Sterolibacteriaceae bacterium MAG5]|nr:tRNA pseudouridine(38-40) synthase TruA [Candidatus Nitricoxidireducens bremensis]